VGTESPFLYSLSFRVPPFDIVVAYRIVGVFAIDIEVSGSGRIFFLLTSDSPCSPHWTAQSDITGKIPCAAVQLTFYK
jgi:hypothetical protein